MTSRKQWKPWQRSRSGESPLSMAAARSRLGKSGERGRGSAVPWAVAAITLVALIALLAGQRFARSNPAVAAAPTDLPATQSGDAPKPPDISQMTPQERAERLYDRVM